jgi:hypothetical protein
MSEHNGTTAQNRLTLRGFGTGLRPRYASRLPNSKTRERPHDDRNNRPLLRLPNVYGHHRPVGKGTLGVVQLLRRCDCSGRWLAGVAVWRVLSAEVAQGRGGQRSQLLIGRFEVRFPDGVCSSPFFHNLPEQ